MQLRNIRRESHLFCLRGLALAVGRFSLLATRFCGFIFFFTSFFEFLLLALALKRLMFTYVPSSSYSSWGRR